MVFPVLVEICVGFIATNIAKLILREVIHNILT